MGIFTKDISTMEDLFLHQLQDIYYAEQQILLRRAANSKVVAENDRQSDERRP
jgi:ferritin-like metal-binding protein YciE